MGQEACRGIDAVAQEPETDREQEHVAQQQLGTVLDVHGSEEHGGGQNAELRLYGAPKERFLAEPRAHPDEQREE